MFVALNPKTAAKIVKDFTTGKVRKEYVARVKGKFPEYVPSFLSLPLRGPPPFFPSHYSLLMGGPSAL
jgi:23S rRNA-/tRNA-specific pseudouridylate synthase